MRGISRPEDGDTLEMHLELWVVQNLTDPFLGVMPLSHPGVFHWWSTSAARLGLRDGTARYLMGRPSQASPLAP